MTKVGAMATTRVAIPGEEGALRSLDFARDDECGGSG
jgi:hypothetical protein